MDDRLVNLMTYTIFHIGVYVSLFTALIGAGIFGALDSNLLRFSIGCFFVAGVCGAIVGSNISEYATFDDYKSARLGPWGAPLLSYWWWAVLEHFAFWVGIVPIVFAYLWSGPQAFKN